MKNFSRKQRGLDQAQALSLLAGFLGLAWGLGTESTWTDPVGRSVGYALLAWAVVRTACWLVEARMEAVQIRVESRPDRFVW